MKAVIRNFIGWSAWRIGLWGVSQGLIGRLAFFDYALMKGGSWAFHREGA